MTEQLHPGELVAGLNIREIDALIRSLQRERAIVDRHIAALEDVKATILLDRKDHEPGNAKAVRNAILDIFKSSGKPMHYRQVYRELVDRGVQVNGKEPDRNVGAHMSNDPRFCRYGGGEWGLCSWRKGTP